MYAFAIVAAILGIVLGLGGAVFGMLWYFDTPEGRTRWPMVGRFLLAAALGASLAFWGISTANSLDRDACESHGFAWINGSCYGGNVNVNGGPK